VCDSPFPLLLAVVFCLTSQSAFKLPIVIALWASKTQS
jgi:hypothetical protein